jgi:hypothetical protein
MAFSAMNYLLNTIQSKNLQETCLVSYFTRYRIFANLFTMVSKLNCCYVIIFQTMTRILGKNRGRRDHDLW